MFFSLLLFLCFGVSPFAASDKMFGLAVPTLGKRSRAVGWHGMAAGGHHGHVADPDPALVWPQGVRVPAPLGANK